jgi:hypothetical protein
MQNPDNQIDSPETRASASPFAHDNTETFSAVNPDKGASPETLETVLVSEKSSFTDVEMDLIQKLVQTNSKSLLAAIESYMLIQDQEDLINTMKLMLKVIQK